MQEALPYKRWETLPPMSVPAASPGRNSISSSNNNNNNDNSHNTSANGDESRRVLVKVVTLVKENPVIVFGRRGCCMCHVVRKLLLGLGVNPPVFEIDDAKVDESLLLDSLYTNVVMVNGDNNNSETNVNVNNLQFPLVFVGGKLFGGLDKVMATHLSGELVPILKQAGALWL